MMPAKILDGKNLASKIKMRIADEVRTMETRPGLAVILIGDNPASRVYVTSKRKDCEECGFYSEEYTLPHDAKPEELFELIDQLNGQDSIDGILVQLPLPPQFNEKEVLMAIDPDKDVDGFHPMNVGKLMTGESCFLPCTPAGVMALLDEAEIDIKGKHCVVLGRSNIVGKPQALLMLQKDATVTICHSQTPDMAEQCRRADILVSAVGKTGLVTPDMVRGGAVIIDVAMNRDENGKLCGDCCRETYEKAFAFTPVPGGVGPMTRAMLMENTLRAAKLHGK